MATESELDPKAAALLSALDEITTDEVGTSTSVATGRAVELLQAQRPTFVLPRSGPWFGFRDEIEELERQGLVEIDVGMAEYHAPGTPAPVVEDLFITLTDAGRDQATSIRRND